MKYMRFMGKDELDALLRSETLTSHRDWSRDNKTGSTGFCFFDCLETPEERLPYLFGVTFAEYCVIFKAKGADLKKSRGRYAKPVEIGSVEQAARTMNDQNMLYKTEYSTEEYSMKTMIPLRIGKVEMHGRPREKEFSISWEEVEKWKQGK